MFTCTINEKQIPEIPLKRHSGKANAMGHVYNCFESDTMAALACSPGHLCIQCLPAHSFLIKR